MAADQDPLQFDSAVPAGAAPGGISCANCQQPIRDVYFEVGGHVLDTRCKDALEQKYGAGAGVGTGEMAKAFVLGSLAAILGALIYLGIAFFLNLEIALIAILVGWMVGKAVRAGSGGRGGRRYQILALTLTYLAISVTYVPAFLSDGGRLGPFGGLPTVLRVVAVFLFAPISAVTTGGAGSILTAIIIGVGLVQAWRQNRGVTLEFKGPFRVAGAPPATSNG